MNRKRILSLFLRLLWGFIGIVSLLLGITGWSDGLRVWFEWLGRVDPDTGRWVFVVVGLSLIAAPTVYKLLVDVRRQRKDKRDRLEHERFQHMGYVAACATVNEYIKYAIEEKPDGRRLTIRLAILDAFEKTCPDGMTGHKSYNGYLLNSWLRYNAAELLIKHRHTLQRQVTSPTVTPADSDEQ